MEIENKVVIVTGASSGIGLATARLLTEDGAKVALVARSKDKLISLQKELKNSFAYSADLTKEQEIKDMVKAVVKHFGKVDILINNAGQGYDSSVETTDIGNFEHLFNLDLVAPLLAMQQVIPLMKAQKEGSIINISSGTALMHLPGMGAYAAIKAALAHLSLTAREEVKNYNIAVSVVYPYITLTDFEKNTINKLPDDNEEPERGNWTQPEADSAEFIAQKIVDCIKNGEPEVFAHEWMKPKE